MSYQYQPGNPWFNPGYRYDGDAHTRPTIPIAAPAVKCECGADSAGCGCGGAHSTWCPKAPRP